MKNIKIFISTICVLLLTSCGLPNNLSKFETVSVTFDACGGYFSDGTNKKVLEVKKGDRVGRVENPTRDGYSLDSNLHGEANWYVESYDYENLWSFIGYVVVEDTTFICNWCVNTYRIDYNLNGGTQNPSNPYFYTIEDAVTFEPPYLSYHTFVDWEDDSGNQVTEIKKGSTGDIHLNAFFCQTDDDIAKEKAEKVSSVSLDEESITLVVGELRELVATVFPSSAIDKRIYWHSSNTGIITVNNNGLVNAVSCGSSVVTVTTFDGGFEASCSIEVITNTFGTETMPLSTDSINEYAKNNVEIGKFSAQAMWCIGVVYSSKYNIETNSYDGWLHCDKAGDSVLRFADAKLSSLNGENFTTTDAMVGCTIKIHSYLFRFDSNSIGLVKYNLDNPEISSIEMPNAIPTGINIVSDISKIARVGDSFCPSARLVPLNASGVVQWISDNPSVAVIDSIGNILCVGEGIAKISANIKDTMFVASQKIMLKVVNNNYIALCNFSNKSYGNNKYSNIWEYDNFTISNGSNNGASWSYVKFGKRNAINEESYIVNTNAFNEPVSYVDVSFNKTTMPKDDMECKEWGVKVYSNKEMTNQIDKVISSFKITRQTEDIIRLNPSFESWPIGAYIKVYFILSDSSGTNGIVSLDYVLYGK